MATLLNRREWARCSALGMLSVPASGLLGQLAAYAAQQSAKAKKKCILLYMDGGPSHIDTFDPKPGNGEFKAIATAIAGVRFAEHLPRLAKLAGDLAILRGMSTAEGSHARAKYYMHTGYRLGAGGVEHPSLGAIVSATLGDAKPELPNFVSVGGKGYGAGYLGPSHSPLMVRDAAKGVEDLRPESGLSAFDARFGVLETLERDFIGRKRSAAAQAHLATYQSAARLIHASKAKAFELDAEPAVVRQAYGTDPFGNGCLLARRLVETGVPFVEVDLGGWDTHKDNFGRVKKLSERLDQGMGALLTDLKTRGLLNETLVIWMGDFGRTPRINNGGRGHYPRAWTTLLAGAGIKTGQVVGRTDSDGAEVEQRPVNVADFMATICKALEIDTTKEFQTRAGRPMRIVDKGANVVSQLWS